MATRAPLIVVAALAMGGLLWLSAPVALNAGGNETGLTHFILVAALISAGIVVYGLCLALFGVLHWGDAIRAIRQREA